MNMRRQGVAQGLGKLPGSTVFANLKKTNIFESGARLTTNQGDTSVKGAFEVLGRATKNGSQSGRMRIDVPERFEFLNMVR